MTIEHAERYLQRLRCESPSVMRFLDYKGEHIKLKRSYTPRQAKKLAKAAERSLFSMAVPAFPPAVKSLSSYSEWLIRLIEWWRFLLRVYDESRRLRAIGEGR
jgi:hypothetical protein